MKQILCFGDSNTWGYDGESRERLPWGVRWTSLLQEKLNKEKYRVIEEGLCGRTTVFEDPLRDGRKGTALLPTLLETHAQVDVITLMLGTNDCKTVFGASADVIGKGILRLLDQIQEYASKSEGSSDVTDLSWGKSMAGRLRSGVFQRVGGRIQKSPVCIRKNSKRTSD